MSKKLIGLAILLLIAGCSSPEQESLYQEYAAGLANSYFRALWPDKVGITVTCNLKPPYGKAYYRTCVAVTANVSKTVHCPIAMDIGSICEDPLKVEQ